MLFFINLCIICMNFPVSSYPTYLVGIYIIYCHRQPVNSQ